jgi:hypothetical protein
MAPNRARLAEIRVQLAMLADMATYPYELLATTDGGTLHLSGHIPNDEIRRHALEIAAAHSPFPVMDELELRLRPDGRMLNWPVGYLPSVYLNQLQRAAEALLRERFPEENQYLAVKAGPHGEVTLTGTIANYEKKLAVSNTLRAVRGCSAVNNQLDVRSVLLHGRRFTVLAMNGERYVPAEYLATQTGPTRLAGACATRSSPYGETRVVAVHPSDSAIPKATETVRADHPGWDSRVGAVPNPREIRQASCKTSDAIEWVASRPQAKPEGRPAAGRPETLALAAPSGLPPALSAPHSDGGFDSADSPRVITFPASKTSVCVSRTDPHWAQPVRNAQAEALPVVCSTPEPSPTGMLRSNGLPRAGGGAMATAGGVIPDAAPAVPMAPPDAVRQAVREACANLASDTVIEMRSPRSVMVRLTVHSREEGMYVWQQVLQHPDLQAYRVDLDINIAH